MLAKEDCVLNLGTLNNSLLSHTVGVKPVHHHDKSRHQSSGHTRCHDLSTRPSGTTNLVESLLSKDQAPVYRCKCSVER